MSKRLRPFKFNINSGNFWILVFLIIASGCQDRNPSLSSKSSLNQSSKIISQNNKNKVTLDKVILRLESDSGQESKIAEVKFNFYGSESLSENFESQKSEIRNLILIHFANSNFKKIPEQNLNIKDPKLSTYLNQFLSSGRIEESEYQLVRVY